ncbi:MAG: hypothetical protein ACR2NZ_13510, partial [Rubripirellula sp.]
MSVSQHLTFLGTPVSVVLSLLAILVTAALGFYAWHRSGHSRSVALLEVLRTSIVALVALMLNQPEWIEEFQPDAKPTIAVLWDDSRSMETQDVLLETSGDNHAITRSQAIQNLTQPEAWSALDENLNVVIQSISGAMAPVEDRASDDAADANATEGGDKQTAATNLKDPLLETAARINQLMGIVLISDGDWNSGAPPVEAASRLRTKNIPIFTVAAGSPSRLPDVELTSVDIPTFGAAGKPVRIPFTIDSSLPRDFMTTVTMTTSDGETLSKDVRVAAMGRTYDALTWKTEKIGDYTLTVAVPQQGEETIPDNNVQSAPIVIRQEQLKVLVVESYPRWEYRYLRNALSRDPGIEVSCLLFHPGLEKVGGGSRDYIKVFPEALEDLSTYDVVFLGDVGLDDGQLTEEQCELLKGLVEQQASGLVFMPGLQGRQFSLLGTALEELNPVIMDESQPGGWGSRTPGHFELTERGRNSLLTKLADTQDENVQVWEDLPGFQWYAPVVRARAGAEVLAVHNEMSNQFGRLPLLATRTFGEGKVLFMGTDGAWRWRKGVEDKYHYRFWGQVVRWMAYQRNMVKGTGMRLFYKPDQPQLKQTLTFSAHVMDKGGEPLEKGDVVATITAPSGNIETLRLIAEGDQWGVFQGRFTPEEPGKHEVTVACQQTGVKLDASFFVRGQAVEQIGKPARPDVLDELALVSRGQAVERNDVNDVIQWLSDLPQPEPSIRRVQLWSHPA